MIFVINKCETREGIVPDIEVDTEAISFGNIEYDDTQLKRAIEELTK